MKYYVNQNGQSDGYHEVHNSKCLNKPNPKNRIYLGDYDSCLPAVREARKYYQYVDGCGHCCVRCHKR